MPNADFGIFFFRSEDEGISDHYALHAKKAVCAQVAEHASMVRDSRWNVLSGDLFGHRTIQILLTTAMLLPDATRLDADLRQGFADARMSSFIPYVIGMFMCPLDSLKHGDTRLKQDKVAGYLGLATFILPSDDILVEIGNRLGLLMTSLHSI